jgi:hypothetical protein
LDFHEVIGLLKLQRSGRFIAFLLRSYENNNASSLETSGSAGAKKWLLPKKFQDFVPQKCGS